MKVFRIVVALISGYVLYRIAAGSDFSAVGRFSVPAGIGAVSLIVLGLAAQVGFLKLSLTLVSAKATTKQLLLIFFSSLLTYHFGIPIAGTAGRLLVVKKVLGVTTKKSLAVLGIQAGAFYAVSGAICLVGCAGILQQQIAVGVVAAALFFSAWAAWRVVREKKNRYVRTVAQIFQRMSFKKLCSVLALQLGVSFLYAAALWVVFRGVGGKINFLALWQIRTISYLAGIVSGSPFGLGTQDLSLTGLLLVLGVARPTALAFVVLTRAFATLFPVGIAFICLTIFSAQQRGRNQKKGDS